MCETLLEFPEGWGWRGPFRVGGVDIFWNYTVQLYFVLCKWSVLSILFINQMYFGEGARLQAYKVPHLIKILLDKRKLVGSTLYLHRMDILCL